MNTQADAETQEFARINDLDSDTIKALRQIVDNIEEREATKERIAEDIKAAYSHAENEGFDKKALKDLVGRRKKMRKIGTASILEAELVLTTYIEAVGDEQ